MRCLPGKGLAAQMQPVQEAARKQQYTQIWSGQDSSMLCLRSLRGWPEHAGRRVRMSCALWLIISWLLAYLSDLTVSSLSVRSVLAMAHGRKYRHTLLRSRH